MDASLKYTINIVLLLLCLKAGAQKIQFTHLSAGTDVLMAVPTIIDSRHTGRGEGYLSLVFNNKVELVTEAGYARVANYRGGNYDYFARGPYGRLGMDFRFNSEKSMGIVGFRFAQSNFHSECDYKLEYTDISGIAEKNRKVMWFEGVAGARCILVKNLYVGILARGRFNPSCKTPTDFPMKNIPGYGPNIPISFAFNLTLHYYFSFRKK